MGEKSGGPVEIAPGITVDSRVRFGKPVIKGTRVDVATVLGHLAAGVFVETLRSGVSDSPEKGVLAAIAYAAEIVDQERVHARP